VTNTDHERGDAVAIAPACARLLEQAVALGCSLDRPAARRTSAVGWAGLWRQVDPAGSGAAAYCASPPVATSPAGGSGEEVTPEAPGAALKQSHRGMSHMDGRHGQPARRPAARASSRARAIPLVVCLVARCPASPVSTRLS
jgi:hypothetical protein